MPAVSASVLCALQMPEPETKAHAVIIACTRACTNTWKLIKQWPIRRMLFYIRCVHNYVTLTVCLSFFVVFVFKIMRKKIIIIHCNIHLAFSLVTWKAFVYRQNYFNMLCGRCLCIRKMFSSLGTFQTHGISNDNNLSIITKPIPPLSILIRSTVGFDGFYYNKNKN